MNRPEVMVQSLIGLLLTRHTPRRVNASSSLVAGAVTSDLTGR
jgi:hypothetical protein